MTIEYSISQCSLGQLLVARSAQGVCAIALGDTAEPLVADLQDKHKSVRPVVADAEFAQQLQQLLDLIERPRQEKFTAPLAITGTEFQRKVWQALQTIPAGQTLSYTQLAERIGAPASVRAVANACGANPLAVVIPCHRVLRSDGDLSGYRWGVARKRELLKREGVVAT